MALVDIEIRTAESLRGGGGGGDGGGSGKSGKGGRGSPVAAAFGGGRLGGGMRRRARGNNVVAEALFLFPLYARGSFHDLMKTNDPTGRARPTPVFNAGEILRLFGGACDGVKAMHETGCV